MDVAENKSVDFFMIINTQILHLVFEQTNEYAIEVFEKFKRSRISGWKWQMRNNRYLYYFILTNNENE